LGDLLIRPKEPYVSNFPRYKTIEVTIGQFLAKYKPSRKQGELDKNRVKRFAALDVIYKAINAPGSPITVDTKGNIISGNHRREGLYQASLGGMLNLDFVIRVVQLEAGWTEQEIAEIQVRTNCDTATSKRREQTLLNPSFPVSRQIMIPLFSSLNGCKFLKRAALLEIVAKVGSIFNNYPAVAGVFSAEGTVAIPGSAIYWAKANPEAQTLGIINLAANIDLRNQASLLNWFKSKIELVDRLMAFLDNEERAGGGDISHLIGSSRTTFVYCLVGAALSGRLDKVSFKSVHKKLRARGARGKLQNRLRSFPNQASVSEDAISEILGLGEVTAHESFGDVA
jgi:hypothetical protein